MNRLWSGLVAGALFLQCEAQIMSVDLGHEFTKVALMQQGKPLEIVLNSHSKRKSTTAVSFFEAIRTFGDDALSHQGKGPTKVPMFFHAMMGSNYTSQDVQAGGKWWDDFALGDKFYPYKLSYSEERGVPTFELGGENVTYSEEVLAHIFYFCNKMTLESSDGKPVRDLVVTVHSDANLRQRQAVIAAGEIAGLRVLTLVHEGSAFAVQRAVDFAPEKNETAHMLYYNMGSRKTEVTIVKMDSRAAGMVAGKTAPVVTVLSAAIDHGIGGHMMDLKIAHAMLKKFQEKNPKLADGVAKNPRALRKLLGQAQKTKATLSANKGAPFNVESLFEDTDFQATIKREEFEEMCADMLGRLTDPIDKALERANVSITDIKHIEVVGGAWRVPKVQQVLSEYFAQHSQQDQKVPLGQHLNGEEASALGSALIAANSSSSFRVKKIFFSDVTAHEYSVQVVSAKGEWEKNVTVLYPVGTAHGGKKKLSFSLEEDFAVKLFEDGILMSEYQVSGVAELLKGKWAEYNLTGPPKITASVPLEMSGIVGLTNALATVEDNYWINVTKEIPKVKNATANDTANASSNSTGEEAKTPETEAETEETEKAAETEDAENSDGPAEGEPAANGSGNATGNTSNVSDVEYETIQKLKKKKHEKKLNVTRIDFNPKPLSEQVIAELKTKLQELAKTEDESLAVAGMKNELEASIYGSRDKLEREDIVKVSTEEQREELSKLCTEYEEWMYEAGSTRTDYETRLQALSNLVGPMEERALELESRPDVEESVKEILEQAKKDHASIVKDMPWVNSNKTEAAGKKIEEFEEWWNKKQEKQKSLPLHEAPAWTKKETQEKTGKIQKEIEKLKKIKKPKEKAPPKAKADATKTAEEALPTDPEVVQKEIDALRAKKAEAVDNEDFDLAHSLKQKEKKLTEHLETLKAEKPAEKAEEKPADKSEL